jgi:uncharacterized membrane protein YeaQ/YmgE (transglycosylase-associated protein family)
MVVIIVILAIIGAIVLGVALIGLALELLWWAIVGLVVGGLARLVLPGMQPIGWLATIGAGIAGAILGGILGDALDWGGFLQFLLAIAVAAGLIVLFRGSRRAYA